LLIKVVWGTDTLKVAGLVTKLSTHYQIMEVAVTCRREGSSLVIVMTLD
jgi:hypothetical protein